MTAAVPVEQDLDCAREIVDRPMDR